MSTARLVVCGLHASLNLLDIPSKAQDVAVPLAMHLSDFQRSEQGWHNITIWGQLLQLTAASSVGNDLFVKAATGITNATSSLFVVSLLVLPVLGVLLVLSGAVSIGRPSTEQTRPPLLPTLTGPAAMQLLVPPSPVPASPMPASAYPGVVERSGRVGGGGGAMGVAQVTQVALSSSDSIAYPGCISSSGSIAYGQEQDSDILCPALVVQQGTGIALAINGELRPEPQEQVLEIIQVENQMQKIVSIFVSESGPDRGILLESTLQFPIAFLDTSRCSAQNGARRVSISRAAAGGVGPSDPSPFAIVEEERDGTTVYRGEKDGSRGRMLQKVSVVQQATGGYCLSIRDARGAEPRIARAEPRQTIDGLPSMLLHIAQAEDSGLAICSVIAAVKLNCFDPSRSSLQPAQLSSSESVRILRHQD